MEGLAVVHEALSQLSQTEERLTDAELWRLKGERMRQTEWKGLPEAEQCLLKAIGVVHYQEAKCWELRAALRWHACSYHKVGGTKRARCTPESATGSSEGFDTSVLNEAKALLNELNEKFLQFL